jgi:hypothetical protein
LMGILVCDEDSGGSDQGWHKVRIYYMHRSEQDN